MGIKTHGMLVVSMPLVFGLLNVVYYMRPTTFQPIINVIPLGVYNDTIQDSVGYPSTIPKAFELGRIISILNVDERLERARELLNVPQMTQRSLEALITELENGEENGFFQRVLGFITFVNVIWLIALLGLTISVGPFVGTWFGPTAARVMKTIAKETLRLGTWLFESTREFHELFCTLISFVVMLCNERFRAGTREYIALIGCLMMLGAYRWFLFDLVRKPTRPTRESQEALQAKKQSFLFWESVANCGALIATISLALKFDSALFGFLAVSLLYLLIGFGVWSQPLAVSVGFKNDEDLAKCTFASALFMCCIVALRILKLSPPWLRPFDFGLQTYGSACYFLGVLISQHTSMAEQNRGFFYVWLFLSLVFGLFVGSVLGIPSIFNSSVVFVVLSGLDVIATSRIWRNPAKLWATIFLGSALIFKLALWMKTNPDWVQSVFMT